MTNLEKVQKIVNVLRILTLIAAIGALVGVCLMLAGSMTLFIPALAGFQAMLFDADTLAADLDAAQLGGLLLSLALCCALYGALLLYAHRCMKAELGEGTPFTQAGANRIRLLGIWSILVPAVTSAVIELGGAPEGQLDFGGGGGLTIGICLILLSVLLRYGAELEQKAGKEQ
ncbi:MAG: hypothetical protein NC337_15760 [Roseburia sp.]|nr:hypothetical protein [Roseburia sp.]